jgi:hypothetical protein
MVRKVVLSSVHGEIASRQTLNRCTGWHCLQEAVLEAFYDQDGHRQRHSALPLAWRARLLDARRIGLERSEPSFDRPGELVNDFAKPRPAAWIRAMDRQTPV